MLQLAGSAGLMLTPRRKASIARGASCMRHVAMAALLIQAAESRMMLLEALQRRERLGDSVQVPLAHRDQIEDVAVFGHLGGQRLGGPQTLARTVHS